MPSLAPIARLSALARRARAARLRLRLRALTGACALAAAGCGAITGSDEDAAGSVVGSYALTHYNDRPVPAVMDEDAGSKEELLAGTLEVRPDFTFSLATQERDTDKIAGQVYAYGFDYAGVVEVSGSAVRLTVTREDGAPASEAWTMTGQLRGGVLRVDLDDDGGEVATFRKR